jgi:hypothetical protein
MGAMQAQDYAMAKWAIGIRLPGSTDKSVEAAIDKGEILRTHVMRPTWHFVTAEDIYWMLELTAPKIKSSMKGRHKALGLTDKLLAKSNAVIEKALSGGEHLTREELFAHLTKAKIPLDVHRKIHFPLWAELSLIICSGKKKGTKQTYALLEKRVPKTKSLNKDEALAKLARQYFSSHCPATVQDFTWWSGLPAGDARHALEMIKSEFVSETIGSQVYWFTNEFLVPTKDSSKSAYLLPAYDEFIISYKDRSAALNFEHNRKTISVNGIFYPTIVLNGEVTGLWRRTFKKDVVNVEAEFFHPHSKASKALIKKAAAPFAHFLEKKIDTAGID